MANNVQVKDASGNTVTMVTTDTGGGVQLANHLLADGKGNFASFEPAGMGGRLVAGDPDQREILLAILFELVQTRLGQTARLGFDDYQEPLMKVG